MRSIKIIATAVAILAIGLATTASAQAPSAPNLKPKIYLGGGTAPISAPSLTKDFFSPNYSLMVGVGLPLNLGVEIMGKFHYHKFGLADAFSGSTISDPGRKMYTIGADAKWSIAPPMSPVKPFLLIGGGNFTLKHSNATTLSLGTLSLSIPPTSESGFFFNIGAGADFKLGPSFAFFVEGKYTVAATDIDATALFPIIAGVRIL